MKTIRIFLQFRIQQAFRAAQEIGLPMILIFLLVTIGFTFKILQALTQVQGIEMALVAFILIASFHASRKDDFFLKKLNTNISLLLLAEYTLLLFPVSILLFFLGKYAAVFYLHLGSLPVIFFPIGFFKKVNTFPLLNLQKIPPQYFELKTGIRKWFVGMSLLYLLALGCSFFVGTLVLFSIFCLLVIPTFFESFEPKEILSLQLVQKSFLKNKVIRHVLLIQLFLLPHIVLFLFFHPQLWYIGLACVLALGLSVAFSIVFKYAAYRPQIPKLNGTAFNAIFLGTLLMPGLVLASVGLIIYFWKKAQQNIEYYYA